MEVVKTPTEKGKPFCFQTTLLHANSFLYNSEDTKLLDVILKSSGIVIFPVLFWSAAFSILIDLDLVTILI